MNEQGPTVHPDDAERCFSRNQFLGRDSKRFLDGWVR
jgi:hypothetical protein